mgnify:CR=1 FL=1
MSTTPLGAFDCDTHIMEQADAFTRHIDVVFARLRSLAATTSEVSA